MDTVTENATEGWAQALIIWYIVGAWSCSHNIEHDDYFAVVDGYRLQR